MFYQKTMSNLAFYGTGTCTEPVSYLGTYQATGTYLPYKSFRYRYLPVCTFIIKLVESHEFAIETFRYVPYLGRFRYLRYLKFNSAKNEAFGLNWLIFHANKFKHFYPIGRYQVPIYVIIPSWGVVSSVCIFCCCLRCEKTKHEQITLARI